MKRNSPIEDIFEISIKKPGVGLVLSVGFGGVGFLLTHKQAPAGAKPGEMLFLPVEHVVGLFFLIIAALLLIFAGIGYALAATRRKKEIRTFTRKRTGAATRPNKPSRFTTKEQYFRWKESSMSKSSAESPGETKQPREQSEEPVINNEPSLTSHPIAMKSPGETDLPQQQNEGPVIKDELSWTFRPTSAHSQTWTFSSIYDALGKIDWYQFEKFSAALLHNEGYDVERRGGAQPDGGVDLIAIKDNETMLVQCKHWKTWEIKPKTVREMIGTMQIHQAAKGAIYTLKGASRAALDLAKEQGIRIEEGNALADRAFNQFSKDQLDSILDTTVHHCPNCEAAMVWREGKFKPFWGCSRYPRCRGKLEYTGAR